MEKKRQCKDTFSNPTISIPGHQLEVNQVPPPLKVLVPTNIDTVPFITPMPRFFLSLKFFSTHFMALMDGGAMINCIHINIMDKIIKDHPDVKIAYTNLPQVGTASKEGSLEVVELKVLIEKEVTSA